MPYKTVDVPPEVFAVVDFHGLKIPVYYVYIKGVFDNKSDLWMQFDLKEKMDSFFVPHFVSGEKNFAVDIVRAIEDYRLDQYMPADLKEKVQAVRNGTYKPPEPAPGSCPKCGNDEYYAHQLCRLDIIVDGENNFLRNSNGDDAVASIYDTERPCGPYTCVECGTMFDELFGGGR